MSLFNARINNWDDWGRIFQSIPAFTPMVEHIFRKERLPLAAIENLHPGSNAVFKVGKYVVKYSRRRHQATLKMVTARMLMWNYLA